MPFFAQGPPVDVGYTSQGLLAWKDTWGHALPALRLPEETRKHDSEERQGGDAGLGAAEILAKSLG